MNKYQVRVPLKNNKERIINVMAENPDDAEAKANRMIQFGLPGKAMSQFETDPRRNFNLSGFGGFTQGMMDLPVGGGQLGAEILNLSGIPEPKRFMDEVVRDRELDAEIRAIDRESQGGTTFDAPRLIGGLMTGGGLTALATKSIPMASTFLKRMFQGTYLGGLYGLFSPEVPDKDQMTNAKIQRNNYWNKKLLSVGFNAVTGLAAVPIIESAIYTVLKSSAFLVEGAKSIANLKNFTTNKNVENAVRKALSEQNLNLDSFSKTHKQLLIDETKKAIQLGKLDDAAVTRMAQNMHLIGQSGTRGQVTRDPKQFTREVELSKQEGGEEIRDTFMQQDMGLRKNILDMQKRTGGADIDEFEFGVKTIDDLNQFVKNQKETENKLWDNFRNLDFINKKIDSKVIQSYLKEVVDDFTFDGISPSLKTKLRQFGIFDPGKKSLKEISIRDIDNIIRNVNQMSESNATFSASGKAIKRQLLLALDELANGKIEFVGKITKDEIASAKSKMMIARKHGADMRELRDKNPIIKKIYDKSASPDDLLKNILSSKVGEVKVLINKLSEVSNDAVKNLQYQIIDRIKNASFNVGAKGDDVGFSATKFTNVLDKIGERRLNIILGEDETRRLLQLQQVAENLKKPPAFSSINYSNTSSAILNYFNSFLTRLGAIEMVSKKIKVDSALSPNVQLPKTSDIMDIRISPDAKMMLSIPTGGEVGGEVRRGMME